MEVHGKINCYKCDLAKELLAENNIEYTYIEYDPTSKEYNSMTSKLFRGINEHLRKFPQIFINKERIGGYEDLKEYLKNEKPLIVIHAKVGCPYCENAKKLLDKYNLHYDEIIYDPNSSSYTKDKEDLFKRTGVNFFPQIFVGKKLIKGYDELKQYKESDLRSLIENQKMFDDTDF